MFDLTTIFLKLFISVNKLDVGNRSPQHGRCRPRSRQVHTGGRPFGRVVAKQPLYDVLEVLDRDHLALHRLLQGVNQLGRYPDQSVVVRLDEGNKNLFIIF